MSLDLTLKSPRTTFKKGCLLKFYQELAQRFSEMFQSCLEFGLVTDIKYLERFHGFLWMKASTCLAVGYVRSTSKILSMKLQVAVGNGMPFMLINTKRITIIFCFTHYFKEILHNLRN